MLRFWHKSSLPHILCRKQPNWESPSDLSFAGKLVWLNCDTGKPWFHAMSHITVLASEKANARMQLWRLLLDPNTSTL